VAFFKFRTINRTTISLRLARSLDDLVDRPNPIELLKVKLVCGIEDVSVIIIIFSFIYRSYDLVHMGNFYMCCINIYFICDTLLEKSLILDNVT